MTAGTGIPGLGGPKASESPAVQDTDLGGAQMLAAVSRWIDDHPANATRDPEARAWGRIAKIGEEAGEVIAAMIAVTGQNPRKPASGTWDDVQKELLDVAVTALGAHEHLTGNQGASMATFAAHLERVCARAGIAVSAPPTPPESPPADERATAVETGRVDTWPICWAKSHGMLCDRKAGHSGDHVDIFGPLPGHVWPSEDPPASPEVHFHKIPDSVTVSWVPANRDEALAEQLAEDRLSDARDADDDGYEPYVLLGPPGTFKLRRRSPEDQARYFTTKLIEVTAERDRLAELVGEEGQEGWDGCSRAEAIRQAMSFHASAMRCADEHDKRRDEREGQRKRAEQAEAERDEALQRAWAAEDKLDLALVNRAEVIDARDRLALDLQARDIAVREADRLREQVEAERDRYREELGLDDDIERAARAAGKDKTDER